MQRAALLGCVALASLAAAGAADEAANFDQAVRLEAEGKLAEAVLAYAAIAGAQHHAARLAREKPAECLAALDREGARLPKLSVELLRAEVDLAQGRKAEAMAGYRRAAASLAGGGAGTPAYLVEPSGDVEAGVSGRGPLAPFTAGPGSHRDNWLIRRFIALEAWDDAAGEFARVWKLHRERTEPYATVLTEYAAGVAVAGQLRLARPAGFDGKGLQFAIEYAYFLKQRGQPDAAAKILLEPLLIMDMDRNPNRATPGEVLTEEQAKNYRRGPGGHIHRRFHGFTAGMARKEYIRLAYGFMKSAGREEELTAALEKQVQQPVNRARRVLAAVRLHQNQPEAALGLELAYVEAGGFDRFCAAFRRGLIYEEFNKLAEASQAYEQVLSLEYPRAAGKVDESARPALPEPDEETQAHAAMSQMFVQTDWPRGPAAGPALKGDARNRLTRLYRALGRNDRLRETATRRLEENPNLLGQPAALEDVLRQFALEKREEDLATWARGRLETTRDALPRAGLYWLLKDYQNCAAELGRAAKKGVPNLLDSWREPFRRAGTDKLRLLLLEYVEANPKDARARLELLDTEDRLDDAKLIPALEALLETDAAFAFQRGKGSYNPTRFRDCYDLAYRLLRLYEKNAKQAELRALGLRLAKGDKPFGQWWKLDEEEVGYRDENRWPEDLSAALAVVIRNADAELLAEMQRLWVRLPDFPAQRQLARRQGAAWAAQDLPVFGWANLPVGLQAIASLDNVADLACDAEYLYAAHPWGVAVYDHQGRGVTRVALGHPVAALACAHSLVWAGTENGLFRIQPKTWQTMRVALDGDVPDSERRMRSGDPRAHYYHSGVLTLEPDGEYLWIGLRRNIQRLHVPGLALRAYSYRELGITSWRRWEWILCEPDYVWADTRDAGLRRYDRKTESWQTIEHLGNRVRLIGPVGERFFVSVYLNDKLRARAAVLDRRTLEASVIPIEDREPGREHCINGPFVFCGTCQGKSVFSGDGTKFLLDEQRMKLRPLSELTGGAEGHIESPVPAGLSTGKWARRSGGRITCDDDTTHRHLVGGRLFLTGEWTFLPMPGGGGALGGTLPADTLAGDERWDGSGGLYLLAPRGRLAPVSGRAYADAMRGEAVFSALPAGDAVWLCTDCGLALLNKDGRVQACFSRQDGLCANRVTGGVSVGEKLYFATGWGDHGGGLAVFEPAVSVFTARFQADGLATDKLANVAAKDGVLELTYDYEYGRGGDYRYRLFPPGFYDPRTGEVRSGGAARFVGDDREVPGRGGTRQPRAQMPVLGGELMSTVEHAGKRYLCGSRGLLIAAAAPPALVFEELAVTLQSDPYVRLKEEADRARVAIRTVSDLAQYAASPNPFIRQNALRHARAAEKDPACVPIAAGLVEDPEPDVRIEALRLLGRLRDPAGLPAARKALADASKAVRREAALASARLGEAPPLKMIEEIWEESRARRGGDMLDWYEALAPLATPELFGVFLRYPLVNDNYEPRQRVFRVLGETLRKRPEAAEVLLRARNTPEMTASNFSAVSFAAEVFRHAGRDERLLKRLEEALRDADRVIRSNAARALGALGDPAFAPLLLKALDLESGLARRSIVWALGRLKSREALPKLAELYVQAKNDEKRRSGGGYRAAQAQAEMQAQYESLGKVEDVGADWDELKSAARAAPLKPREQEELLEVRHVLEAVAAIGPEAAQDFYRRLAGEKDTDARLEAAQRLAECAPADVGENVRLLRNLLGDDEDHVRAHAAAGLLMLGQTDVQGQVLAALGDQDRWRRERMLRALLRVPGDKLGFARELIEKLAVEEARSGRSSYERPAQRLAEKFTQPAPRKTR